MSRRYIRSRSINHLRRTEDGLAPEIVLACLKPSSADQINLSPEDFTELLMHVDHIKQCVLRGRVEFHQDIDVAFGAEVFSERGAEDGEFAYLPSAAEVREGFSV